MPFGNSPKETRTVLDWCRNLCMQSHAMWLVRVRQMSYECGTNWCSSTIESSENVWNWKKELNNITMIVWVIIEVFSFCNFHHKSQLHTWMGNHNVAKANTTTTTSLVTRFRPRWDSADIFPPTTVCHKRMHIRRYRPLIRANGIRYDVEKNMIW